MALVSAAEQAGPADAWVDWFLRHLQQDPWVLGGLVVMGVFVLAASSLVLFALLYGCCCGPPAPPAPPRRRPRSRGSRSDVI